MAEQQVFVYAPDGKCPVGGLAVDITERKHGEQSLQLAATVFESSRGHVCYRTPGT
ncbi:MAG: hypothetical protein IPO19_11930 [Rhodoferax sp.]|nr:hypothetical protein [Rhodoferax sp.]